MVEFVRSLIMNNTFVIMSFFAFFVLLSLLACRKIREVIFGSVISSFVTLTIAITSKIDSINCYLSDISRLVETVILPRTSLNVAGTRNILVAMNIFKNDCSYDLLCVFNLFDYVILIKNTSAILIRSFVLKIKTKLIYCKNTIESKSLICRKQFSIRI